MLPLIRSLILLGLLAFFANHLLHSVREDQKQLGLGRLPQSDPGVRVLLLDRGMNGNSETHDQVELTVLQPAYILTPDDPENPERVLHVNHGERLIIKPDAGDGLLLWTQTYGKDLRWPVTRLRIQPQATKPELDPEQILAKVDPSRFEAADCEAVFAMGDRRYRGSLEVVWRGAKELMAINCLPMESYVEAVIAVEMQSSYPLEALKAQAIVSRSYAFGTWLRDKRKNREYVVADSNVDQEYRGTGFGNTLLTAAVYETRGVIMWVNNSPFIPMFSASSGGYSESIDALAPGARDVYGKNQLSLVMPAQPDQYCESAADALYSRSTHWLTTTVIKKVDIMRNVERWLRQRNDSRTLGRVHGLKVTRRDPVSRRVQTVLITGQNNNIEMSGHEFRMLMGPKLIKSTLWTEESPVVVPGSDPRKDYQIQCYGYGHGVGMSQISAWWMAKELNYTSDQILQAFYPGAQRKPWSQ
jgi:stage II sporulation protein D